MDDYYPWSEYYQYTGVTEISDTAAVRDPFSSSNLFDAASVEVPALLEIDLDISLNRGGFDPFSRIPWELCEIIASHLSTEDAFNARLASRALVPLFSSHRFWSSQFEPDASSGFLFEATEEIKTSSFDRIRSLYRLSKKPAFSNRERVWRLARYIVRLVQPTGVFSVEAENLTEKEWIRIAAKEPLLGRSGNWDPFLCGCQSFQKMEIDVRDIKQLTVALAVGFEWDDITGIKVLKNNGKEQVVGYGFGQNDIVYNLTRFYGFRVAVGRSGIKALQPVDQHGTKWIGRTANLPISQRLVSDSPITHIEVDLDVSKL